jgi:hypothetical protein
MSSLTVAPELLAAAATDVAAIGSSVSAAHLAAAAPTVTVLPAAADQVSAAVAQLFSKVGQDFQGLAGKAAAFGAQFSQQLHANAGTYAAAEAVSAASLDTSSIIQELIDAPAQLLNVFTGVYNSIASVAKLIFSAIQLPFYIGYELLVLSYLTLAGLIGLEQTLAKLLTGSTIPIP